jgi:hypothetical protein
MKWIAYVAGLGSGALSILKQTIFIGLRQRVKTNSLSDAANF